MVTERNAMKCLTSKGYLSTIDLSFAELLFVTVLVHIGFKSVKHLTKYGFAYGLHISKVIGKF